MQRSLKDRALIKAGKITKEHKILTPFVYIILAVVLLMYRLILHVQNNVKRYIVISMAFVFFFMSSSFSFPENIDDSSIYLDKSDVQVSTDSINNETVIDIEDNKSTEDEKWIEDSDIISDELQKELSNTDNIDTFTLSDFLNKSDISLAGSSTSESAFDKNAWNLILVNKTHPVPDDYNVPLTTLSGNMKCDERVLEPLTTMLSGAAKDGVSLIVCSPYRDYQLQTTLFNRKINAYMNKGYSYMDAYKLTCSNVTVPGASEHQIGMAFDIVTNDHKVLDYEFGKTIAGKWLYNHCYEYGFILRYPADKTDITGIMYEPWHFRYVGIEAATYIMENNLTLEEFIDGL